MTNNTNAISVSADFDMTALLSVLQNSKATVIVINNGTPIDMTNVVDVTATEVVNKKHCEFNHHAYYVTSLSKVLATHKIKVKTGKGGAKREHISARVFNELVSQLETKEVTMRKVKFLFNALDEAGYKEEGRGLKNDIVFEVLNYIKENDYASYNNVTQYHKAKNQHDLDNLVERLKKLILTNNFAEKFHEFLREDDARTNSRFTETNNQATAEAVA